MTADDAILRRIAPGEVALAIRPAVDEQTLQEARAIVDDVRRRGEPALREHAERLGDLEPGAPLVWEAEALREGAARVSAADRALLERTAVRIRRFAAAQRAQIQPLEIAIPGGSAGHRLRPLARAGCYAPGGRYPLPSSILMTAVTARAAGVGEVWLATPRPDDVSLAAAAVAGVDGVLAVGGAQAIAALAYGAGPVPACDAVVGPGNRWVTAAKRLVAGDVRIDMLAGPSELVVVADGSADPALVAADLLAQAEHDVDARPILVAIGESVAAAIDAELADQLRDLPTADVAQVALRSGFAVVVSDRDAVVAVCDRIAPEHLQLSVSEPEKLSDRFQHYGALFVGAAAGEVLGDYGAGPNHVLPTGGSARYSAGLSVHTFLRLPTWLAMSASAPARELARDAARLAELEGLWGHARAARRRTGGDGD